MSIKNVAEMVQFIKSRQPTSGWAVVELAKGAFCMPLTPVMKGEAPLANVAMAVAKHGFLGSTFRVTMVGPRNQWEREEELPISFLCDSEASVRRKLMQLCIAFGGVL